MLTSKQLKCCKKSTKNLFSNIQKSNCAILQLCFRFWSSFKLWITIKSSDHFNKIEENLSNTNLHCERDKHCEIKMSFDWILTFEGEKFWCTFLIYKKHFHIKSLKTNLEKQQKIFFLSWFNRFSWKVLRWQKKQTNQPQESGVSQNCEIVENSNNFNSSTKHFTFLVFSIRFQLQILPLNSIR